MASAITISVLVYLVSSMELAYAGSKSCTTGSETTQLKLKNVKIGELYVKVQTCQKDGKVVTGGVSNNNFWGLNGWFLRTSGVNSSFSDKGVVSKNGFKVWKVSYKRNINVCVGIPSNWKNYIVSNPFPFTDARSFVVWIAEIGADFIPNGSEQCAPFELKYDSYSYPSGETDIENVQLRRLGDW